MPAIHSITPPPVGTLIDDGTLELVEVLGVGGYGVVYRAVDVYSLHRKSWAVKCLMHMPSNHSARQRQLHIREITLHQLASAHPNVVSLHRVIEEPNYTYLVMDYAYDGDLFTQILHNSRYLGDGFLIKHVFLQILDAVEHCHSLGIYHRDLKPENVLCFDGGFRVAITDFGLATTEKLSEEFRTGSVYHMSPECQGGRFASSGNYSPLANDIWSLAIILLNLATGRNPWKSASITDPTFQAYLVDPEHFLPTVLPISEELNAILVQMLHIDWRMRMSLRDIRDAIVEVETFYSDGAIFEGSMARCPWEAGMDIESGSDCSSTKGDSTEVGEKEEDFKSFWSQESDMVQKTPSVEHVTASPIAYQTSWMEYSPSGAAWDSDPPLSPSSPTTEAFRTSRASMTPPSTHSPLSPADSGSLSSQPATPRSVDMPFAFGTAFDDLLPSKRLIINTDVHRDPFDGSISGLSRSSSMMQTAIESCNPYAESFFLASAVSSKGSCVLPATVDWPFMEDGDTEDMSWTYSAAEPSPSVRSMHSTGDTGYSEHSFPDISIWPERPEQLAARPHVIPPLDSEMSRDSTLASPSPSEKKSPGSKKLSLFTHIRFPFPRTPPASPPPAHASLADTPPSSSIFSLRHTPSPPSQPTTEHITGPPPSTIPSSSVIGPLASPDGGCRRHARLRSARHWFSPAKLFAVS